MVGIPGSMTRYVRRGDDHLTPSPSHTSHDRRHTNNAQVLTMTKLPRESSTISWNPTRRFSCASSNISVKC